MIYRPASDTVTVFSRRAGARVLTFERRAQSDDLVDVETGSHWNAYGECLEGQLRGGRLNALFGMRQFWWAWAAFYPGTDVYAGMGLAPR